MSLKFVTFQLDRSKTQVCLPISSQGKWELRHRKIALTPLALRLDLRSTAWGPHLTRRKFSTYVAIQSSQVRDIIAQIPFTPGSSSMPTAGMQQQSDFGEHSPLRT
jgi:hypothetical protein